MENKNTYNEKIEQFMFKITESEEYQSIKYLVFSIRKLYLHYLSNMRVCSFECPLHLKKLVKYVDVKFTEYKISPDKMLNYMLEHDVNNWIHYYTYTFLTPAELIGTNKPIHCDRNLYILVLTGYILDKYREKEIDIQNIVNEEQLLYQTNQYGLTIVNNVDFRRDYFIFEDKAYLYNILANTQTIDFGDEMPGFARIISKYVSDGDLLLRLDDRLALPKSQAISYSTLNFEKFRGPQFRFSDSKFEKQKTIIVHINSESSNKLLMVIKKDFDKTCQKAFFHIEIETLPYINGNSKSNHCITTFLHGMYYIDDDSFKHIDYARNQYKIDDYLAKYKDFSSETPIDFYAKKELHYKIWCIENGNYSREIWYNLMIVSLSEEYRVLLDEMLS